MFTEQMQQDVIMVLKFPSNSPVAHVAANTQAGLTAPAIITVTANRLFAVNKWHGLAGEQGGGDGSTGWGGLWLTMFSKAVTQPMFEFSQLHTDRAKLQLLHPSSVHLPWKYSVSCLDDPLS